ncbi:hypothetical protein GBA52_004885 [Prunus armeniaca]|nr:hypothetical protein GBA52_004885 [Prunus armeniaca]
MVGEKRENEPEPVCWERLVFPNNEEEATDDPSSLDDNAANLPWTYTNHIEGQSFDYFLRRFAREFEIDYSRFSIASKASPSITS